MLKNLLVSVIINTAVLVIIALRIPFGGLTIEPLSWNATPILLLMGFFFWLVYQIVRPILKALTAPINWLTLGIAGILINLIVLYLFAAVVNNLNFGIAVTLGTIVQTFVLSIIVTILTMLLKKIFG